MAFHLNAIFIQRKTKLLIFALDLERLQLLNFFKFYSGMLKVLSL